MTYYSRWYIDKLSGSLADSLVVHGFAQLLLELSRQRPHDNSHFTIRIQDRGPCYCITCDPPLSTTWLAQMQQPLTPIPLIITDKNRKILNDVPYENRIDYEVQKLRRGNYLASLATQKILNNELGASPAIALPHLDWEVFRAINPAALPGYNGLITAWAKTAPKQTEILTLLFDLFSQFPNDFAQAERSYRAIDKANGWDIQAKPRALQLFNPDQGKGQNRPKANILAMEGVESRLWLVEFLKVIGLYYGGITRTLRGTRDRKTYILAPITMDFATSSAVLSSFKASMLVAYPSITSDLMVLVKYVQAMLRWAEQSPDGLRLLFGRARPQDVVAGFYAAYYKDLGSAVTTMNSAFLALPSWLKAVQSSDDLHVMQALMEEIERVIWSADELHSEGLVLLSRLRDFLSSSDLSTLFAFTAPYASYILRQHQRNKYAHRLSFTFLRSVLMGITQHDSNRVDLQSIIQNPGFLKIAYAIRQSTVTAQYNKMRNKLHYTVHYGLIQNLARTARYSHEFMITLSQFIAAYNLETVRVLEQQFELGRTQFRSRARVTEQELIALASLIDGFGSSLVANLLIAFGSAGSADNQPMSIEQSGTDFEALDPDLVDIEIDDD